MILTPILQSLHQTGIHEHQPALWLDEDRVESILHHLKNRPMFSGHVGTGQCATYEDAKKDFRSFAPSLASVLLGPYWLEYAIAHLPLARSYFDGPAWLYSLNAFWIMPGSSYELHLWHRDTDAPSQMAVFMLASDTTPDDGAHEYQVETHWTSDADLGRHVNEPPSSHIQRVYGRKGKTFVMDPWGIHRGQPCSKERVLLWARFADTIPDEKFLRKQIIPAYMLGERYPSDPETREAIRLIVQE